MLTRTRLNYVASCFKRGIIIQKRLGKVITGILILLLSSTGCSTPAYKRVLNEKAIGNSKEFSAPFDSVYQAAMKALCAKGFFIESEDKEKGFILGKRCFQEGKKTNVLLVQAKIIPGTKQDSILYLNAVETTEVAYIADRTRFFMFIIPLPGGGGKEATRITQGEKAVQDRKFYDSFFKLIEDEVNASPAHTEQRELAQ